MREFNKEEFDKSQNRLTIMWLLIGVVAIASIICSLSLNNLNTEENPEDTKELYGKYYGIQDYTILKIEINDENCILEQSNGLKGKEETYYYSYKYYSSYKDANNKTGKAVVFKPDNENRQGVLWVETENPLSFRLNNSNTILTKKEKTIEDIIDDPKDYFYKYESDNCFIKFNENKTVDTNMDGITDTYDYLFVNRHWLEKFILTKTYYDKAIVIYRYGFDNVTVFKYVNNKLLRYENQNFTR